MRPPSWFLTFTLAIMATLPALGAQGSAPQVYAPGNGVTLPSVVKEVRPEYTKEAKEARIQGTVLLDCVVLTDGKVGNVSVSRSLDSTFGLDQEAVKAAKQWLFKPGTKDGKPVAVRVMIELTFMLK
jgi:periplasmic protein TonB